MTHKVAVGVAIGVAVESVLLWWWMYARLSPAERKARADRADGL
jgi:hypothetical protein